MPSPSHRPPAQGPRPQHRPLPHGQGPTPLLKSRLLPPPQPKPPPGVQLWPSAAREQRPPPQSPPPPCVRQPTALRPQFLSCNSARQAPLSPPRPTVQTRLRPAPEAPEPRKASRRNSPQGSPFPSPHRLSCGPPKVTGGGGRGRGQWGPSWGQHPWHQACSSSINGAEGLGGGGGNLDLSRSPLPGPRSPWGQGRAHQPSTPPTPGCIEPWKERAGSGGPGGRNSTCKGWEPGKGWEPSRNRRHMGTAGPPPSRGGARASAGTSPRGPGRVGGGQPHRSQAFQNE